jgi:rSAM/selenodomain-associated transferase 2
LVSIIIPTLNEASAIGTTLQAAMEMAGPAEIIVVDGRSEDGTAAIARERGARVYISPRGRGCQMHAGSLVAHGEVLWFLHADTQPPVDGVQQILRACEDQEVIGGNFAVKFAGKALAARFLTWLYPHLSWFGLCYGDSTIFVRRDAYERVGGFQSFLLFEDLDLVRRLKQHGRYVRLPGPVVTSSRRFEGRSFTLTFMHWAVLQLLYWLGVKPWVLARFYGQPAIKGVGPMTGDKRPNHATGRKAGLP